MMDIVKTIKKYFLGVYVVGTILALLSGIIFYRTVVGNDSTNIFSVIFGWQWIYLTITCLVILLTAWVKKSKTLLITAGIILVSLVLVLVPARLVESSRIYITGEGGPAGPEFGCLVWDNNYLNLRSGAYEGSLGLCTLMSIPSYNKFLIDRSPNADQLDASTTYYIMLAINEAILVGGSYLAYRKLTVKSKT